MSYRLSHLTRAQAYADANKISLIREDPFGYGMDGTIWRTSRHSVVKVFEHEKNYRDELECYRRFQAAGVETISGFAVPELIGFHAKLHGHGNQDRLAAVSARLRQSLPRRPAALLERRRDHGPLARRGQRKLRPALGQGSVADRHAQKYGIYYVDPKPGNIMFAD